VALIGGAGERLSPGLLPGVPLGLLCARSRYFCDGLGARRDSRTLKPFALACFSVG
jgi:hypothetical protein